MVEEHHQFVALEGPSTMHGSRKATEKEHVFLIFFDVYITSL